jgi:hypothetical protein
MAAARKLKKKPKREKGDRLYRPPKSGVPDVSDEDLENYLASQGRPKQDKAPRAPRRDR